MKQIGYHANIVALVGACTVCDPIALIMEYMSYGNLQTFLQCVLDIAFKLINQWISWIKLIDLQQRKTSFKTDLSSIFIVATSASGIDAYVKPLSGVG